MCDVSVQTLPRCIVCNAVLAIIKPSVRPSTCPSKTKESCADILIPASSSSFLTRRMVGGGRPLLPEILDQTDPKLTLQKRIFPIDIHSYNASAVTPSEKSSIIANRRSTTGFPMSLGWTAYLTPKPQRGSKTQSVRLPYKSGLLSKKVCYNVSLCENFQRQHCKAFTGLSICAQMVGEGYRFLPEILGQIDQPPLKNVDFESIFARSASTITLRN